MKQRIEYMDCLRIAAIFCVIMCHVAGYNWYTTDVFSAEWQAFNFYDSIGRWSLTAFVMISGALFLEKKRSIKELFQKNIFRMVIAYVFWAVLYGVIYSASHSLGIKGVIIAGIKGYYHLWFLFLIVGLYIVTPFLQKIVESMAMVRYFLCASLAFTFVIPLLIDLCYVVSGELGKALESAYGNAGVYLVVGYVFYFVLGYYLHKITITKWMEACIYIIGLSGFVLTVFVAAKASMLAGEPVGDWYGDSNINIMLCVVAVFVFFKQHMPLRRKDNRRFLFTDKLSKYTFGVYLVHVMVAEAIFYGIGWDTLSFPPYISVPVFAVIIFVGSMVISGILNHIPIVQKYLV